MYDSGHAAGATQRTAPVHANVEAMALNRRLLANIRRGRRHGSITFVHVKGHLRDPGNDRADKIVQWGKGRGSYKLQYRRLDIDGGYEEPAPTELDATRRPKAIQLESYKQQCDNTATVDGVTPMLVSKTATSTTESCTM